MRYPQNPAVVGTFIQPFCCSCNTYQSDTMVTGDNSNQQLLALLFSHSIIVKLITSHYRVKFIALLQLQLSMIEILCSKSSITADTAFRKFYPAGVHKQQHTLDQPRKNQLKTQRGIHDKAITGFKNISGGHPTKLPATKLVGSKTDPGFADTAKRLGTRKCDWACRYRENTPLP